MKFNQTFYHYQNEILKVFNKELEKWDNKIHIVAPPGSWKTIIWIEIMRKLFLEKEWISLILVPNTVLQKQWKDKILNFFIEKDENIENLVSFELEEIKKINILTYQSISQQDRKKSKKNNEILTEKVLKYFFELKEKQVSSIVLDEAHHLTAWWSKVIFEFYMTLQKPYVVWLTATPPFDDLDYFSLDKNYVNLLWEVDYYIPTPAIIKSWKLAPYNDLVQFVELPDNASEILLNKKQKLDKLIDKNKNDLNIFFTDYLKNYNKNINDDKNINKILTFCNIYLSLKSNKFNLDNFINLDFEKIIYSISIWIREYKKNNINIFNEYKNILYEIWYVWKKSKFVKFYSYIDKLEIYNPNKINAVKNILDKEIFNLWDNLRCVIITDFFEDIDWLLDCKNILKNLWNYKKLNPILVSGQWFFTLDWVILNKNILEITKDFNNWKSNLLIWTRWFLWEWWDSPKVNTLIDLTWISSFMSTNQVRWRAIRLDKENNKKVSNIYDIVTIDKNNILYKDFLRLKKKHNQVYWVDDLGLVIKGVEHIYQNLNNKINISEFNNMMLSRSEKRGYFYKLWWVWENFKNKEQFILQLNINPLFKFFPNNVWIFAWLYTFIFKYKDIKLKDIWKKTYYDIMISKYINKFLYSAKKILIDNNTLSKNFSYQIIIESAWKYKIIWWKDSDDFEVKKFIEIVSKIFSPVLDQKYLFNDKIKIINNWKINKIKYSFPLPSQLSWNKEIRKNFYDYFYKYSIVKLNLVFFWEIRKSFEYINNNRKKHLWYSTFINSEIEKIWI